jgi:hypothetical protein
MSISTYIRSNLNNQTISSEISSSNILSYKRRSNLFVKNDSSQTLENCHKALLNLKKMISKYIKVCKSENRNLLKKETSYLDSLIQKINTEILTVYHLYLKNNKDINQNDKKIVKKIEKVANDLNILYINMENLRDI